MTKLLFLATCFLAEAAFGAESYSSFAKQSLALDLASIPFGTNIQTSVGFGKTDPPLGGIGMPKTAGFSWMTNNASEKYHQDFPNRYLKFGIRDGKIAAVQISINRFAGESVGSELVGSELFEKRHKEMIQIHTEFIKARQAAKASTSFADEDFDIRYGAMCSPSPESLYVMEFQITPAEKASWDTGNTPGEKKKPR